MTDKSPNWCKIWILKNWTFRKFEWSALKLLEWRILLEIPLGFWGSLKAPRPPAARCASRDACRWTPLWKFLPTGLNWQLGGYTRNGGGHIKSTSESLGYGHDKKAKALFVIYPIYLFIIISWRSIYSWINSNMKFIFF